MCSECFGHQVCGEGREEPVSFPLIRTSKQVHQVATGDVGDCSAGRVYWMMKEPEEEENLGKKRKVKMRMGKKLWKGKENGRQKIKAER